MQRFKPYVLPVAIVLGVVLHNLAPYLSLSVPYIIFAILTLNFAAVDLRKMPFTRLDTMIMVFQTAVSMAGYWALRLVCSDEVYAQGLLIAVLCPVASSVVVVASALGADRRVTTAYTIYGNLLVAAVAPVYFSFVGINQDMPLLESMWMIFKRIALVIALPYVLVLVLQCVAPRVKDFIGVYRQWAFPLWAFALFATLGQTIDYVFLYHEGNEVTIAWLGVVSLAVCVVQFAVGRMMGRSEGHEVAGGQLLGQKNTAIGIWMASVYLMPLASVTLAFYAIFQNLFNSWQLWVYERQRKMVA